MPDEVTESDHAVTELGQTGAVLLAELEDASAQRAAADDRILRVRVAIEALLTQAGATDALVDGQPIVTWRPQVSRRFDQSLAKRLLAELGGQAAVDACTVEAESRPFRRVTA